jgi:hypothetical protein
MSAMEGGSTVDDAMRSAGSLPVMSNPGAAQENAQNLTPDNPNREDKITHNSKLTIAPNSPWVLSAMHRKAPFPSGFQRSNTDSVLHFQTALQNHPFQACRVAKFLD